MSERDVRDLPCMEFGSQVALEVYRVCYPDSRIISGFYPVILRFHDALAVFVAEPE